MQLFGQEGDMSLTNSMSFSFVMYGCPKMNEIRVSLGVP